MLEFLPGEEAQVDYGLGALTLYRNGKYKRPYLFVMTLKYSGKSFRKVVWKTSQETWARLHEEAFRAFGGCPRYVVLDNLKEGVMRPDIYEPELNPLYARCSRTTAWSPIPAAYVTRIARARSKTRSSTRRARRSRGARFESIEEQNAWLAHWEERWAALRIHGRKKRQVLEMFHEEQPHLRPLPVERLPLLHAGDANRR